MTSIRDPCPVVSANLRLNLGSPAIKLIPDFSEIISGRKFLLPALDDLRARDNLGPPALG